MLLQPLEVLYNSRQCNAAAPGCCRSPPEKLARDVPGQLFADRDP